MSLHLAHGGGDFFHVARGAEENLGALEMPALLQRLEHWTRRTLHDFARDSLKPTVLANLAQNGGDGVALRSFTVIRYPAQAN